MQWTWFPKFLAWNNPWGGWYMVKITQPSITQQTNNSNERKAKIRWYPTERKEPLRPEETLCHSDSSERTLHNAGVKMSNNNNNNTQD